MTQFAEAFKAAGFNVAYARARQEAHAAMDAALGNRERAADKLARAVRDDPAVIVEMAKCFIANMVETEASFRRWADGGQVSTARERHIAAGAADSPDLATGDGHGRLADGQHHYAISGREAGPGHAIGAANGQSENAGDSSDREVSGGHTGKARNGPGRLAPDNSSRGGQNGNAASGHIHAANPRDETKRRKAALRAVATTVSVYDDFRTRFDIDLRRVQMHELPKLAQKHRVIARLLKAMHRHQQNADPFAYVPDIFKEGDIEQFLRNVEMVNDYD